MLYCESFICWNMHTSPGTEQSDVVVLNYLILVTLLLSSGILPNMQGPLHTCILPHQKGTLQTEHLACLFVRDALTTFRSLASHSICRSPGTCWFYISPWAVYTPFNLVVSNWIVLIFRVWNKSMWYDWLFSNLTSLGNLFLNYQELKFTQ